MTQLSTWTLCLLVTLGLAISACSLFGTDEEQISVQVRTKQETYTPSSTIVLEVSNRGNVPVYHAGCPVITLQELQGDGIPNQWTVSGFEYCGGRLALDAVQSIERSLDLSSAFLQERLQGARFDESVDYRLDFVDLYRSESDGRLSEGNRQSNRFRIIGP